MASPARTPHSETPHRWKRPSWLHAGLLWFALDLLAPTALIYVFLWLNFSLYIALLASAAYSAVGALVSFRRGTGKQRLAPYMLAFTLVGFGVALVSGSERFLLAKESVLTAMAGFWFLASLWNPRPLTYQFTRPLLERRLPRKTRSWEWLWEHEPRFRRIWIGTTVMWSAALLIDAILRVVLAYTLPVEVVPIMQTGLIIVTTLVMQVLTNVYFVCAGLWSMLHEEPTMEPH